MGLLPETTYETAQGFAQTASQAQKAYQKELLPIGDEAGGAEASSRGDLQGEAAERLRRGVDAHPSRRQGRRTAEAHEPQATQLDPAVEKVPRHHRADENSPGF